MDGANYWTDELSLDKEGTGMFWQSTGQMAGLGNGLLNGFQDTLKGSSSVAAGDTLLSETAGFVCAESVSGV